MTERLQKYLSRCGVASRRAAEGLITKGLISINGKIAKLGDKVDPGIDLVTYKGVPVNPVEKIVTYILNKPRGYVSSTKDRFNHHVVTELVPNYPPVYPAGRLDKNSEGLMILTNDGDLAQIIMHPSLHIEKEYVVLIDKEANKKHLKVLKEGLIINGEIYKAKSVSVIAPGVIKIVLSEGKKRMIRVMLKELGFRVLRLVRVRIGVIRLGQLSPGSYRIASFDEIAWFYSIDPRKDLPKRLLKL
jgi:23S rRNA pseudouridine2605 synthase